jgi:putative ABC transport system permease protein
MGLTVGGYAIEDPHVHPMQEQVDAVLIVLGVMGGLSLVLSAFLIINTINAILVREVQQIGVMKAVGAALLRIMRIYLATALIYGALALLLAVPLGLVGAHLVAVWLLDMFNVTLTAFQFEPLAAAIQVAIALAVPPAAALAPVLNAARITVREAISDYGLSNGFGEGWLDRLVARVRGLPSVIALSLRNTFRRKGRVALTLAMLTFSGAMFTMVMSTRDALDSTFQVIFELEGDVAISLGRPYRARRLIEIAQGVPGVARAEVWHSHGAAHASWRGEGEEPVLRLTGVPAGSAMFKPRIIDGRNLQPGDGRAILVNNRLVAEEGLQIGDVITLRIDGDTSDWTVVGSYLSLNVLQDICFVPREALARETHARGQGTSVKVLTGRGDLASQQRLIASLTEAFEANNVEVTDSWSASQQWQESQSAFSVLIYLLLAMAVLVAVVGSIGLMSAMSINVVERTGEIGVMRAIGANAATIVGVFVVEGVLVGVLSWLLAVPLSAPGAYGLSSVVGQAIVQIPLDFAYSTTGALLWLLIVVLLSALASLAPALRATRVSVRESLAYE